MQNQIRISIEEDAKPNSPEPEEIMKPRVNRGPRGRARGPKRKRDTSESSCDSNQQDKIIKNGKFSTNIDRCSENILCLHNYLKK